MNSSGQARSSGIERAVVNTRASDSRRPRANRWPTHMRFALVVHGGILGEDGKHRVDVMRMRRVEVSGQRFRQHEGHWFLLSSFLVTSILAYTACMARTDRKVRYSPTGK